MNDYFEFQSLNTTELDSGEREKSTAGVCVGSQTTMYVFNIPTRVSAKAILPWILFWK